MDSKDILRRVGETLNRKSEDSKREKEQTEKERRELVTSIGKDISEALLPYMQSMAEKSQITKEDIKAALSEVQINVPESNVNIPEFKIPAPQVTVNVPEMKIPQVNIPPTVFPERMSVGLENYSNKTPMPVMMVDTKGNPFQFSFPTSGGGKTDFFTVKGIQNTIGIVTINPDGSPAGAGSVASSVSVSDIFSTVGSNVVNADGRVRVSVETGGSGITDSEIRATALPVSQLSGAEWSTVVNTIFGTTGTNVVNPDNRLKVELPTGSSGLTDTELRAAHLDVQQVSGAIDSVNVLTMPAVVVTSITNTVATSNVDSTGVQYSGSNPFPFRVVTDATATVNVVNVDSAGAYRSTFPVSGSVTVASITASTAVNIGDSSGVGYSGSNPLPITLVSGGLTSTISVGSVVADAVDDGSAPVQHGGIARTANPTAVAGNDVVKATYDDLGRQVMRVNQVRDLTLTAYTSISNGTETTLRAAVAGAYLDLTMLKLGNTSDAAVSVDVRAVSAGNIVDTIVVPPYGTAGWSSTSPYPQSDTGNNWTIDMPDITGTTVYATALFSQEI